MLFVSRWGLHEDRHLKTGADSAEDSNTRSTKLWVRPFHCAVGGGPCACAPHPHVERRLVEVNKRLSLLHQTSQMQGESHQRFIGAILGLLITEADYSVLDVVLHVEVAQRVGFNAHVEVLFQLYATLLKAHETPVLKHFGVQ